MTAPFVSLHGRRLGMTPYGLMMDGRVIGGSTPTGLGRGKTWYVDSAIAGSDGSSPDTALGTLDAAFAKCTANQGDVIIVLPNHAETITGASGITHDVAGVSVIGLGNYNQRPRFLMDAGTSVTYVVSAADAYIENLEFASGHSNVVTCFDVTAVGCTINKCKFGNNTTNEDFLTCITASGAANTADGLTVTNCEWYTIDTDDLGMIKLVDNVKNLVVVGNRMLSAGTAGSAYACTNLINTSAGKIVLNAEIAYNRVVNLMTAGELLFSTNGSTNTGIVHNNYVGHADVTGAHDLGIDGAGFRCFNNYSTSVDNLSGVILPAADVDL
jgi:hypothetical protein